MRKGTNDMRDTLIQGPLPGSRFWTSVQKQDPNRARPSRKAKENKQKRSSRWPRQLELSEVRTIKLLEMRGVCAPGSTGLQSLNRIPIGGNVAQQVKGSTYLRTTYKPDVDWAT